MQGLRALATTVMLVAIAACAPAKSPLGGGENATPDEDLFQEGLALYDANDFAGAQAKFDELVADFPASTRHDNAGYLAGRCRYELAAYDDAITSLIAMRTQHPDSPYISSAAYFTGRSRYEIGDFAGSVADFETSVAADAAATYADNAQYYVGRANYEAGDLAAAVAGFDKLEGDFPDSSYLDNGRYYLGRSYFNRGDYALAMAPLERVFLTPDSIYLDDARFYIGRSEYAIGSLAPALADFEEIVTTYPTSQYVDNAIRWEIQIYTDEGDCAAAEAALTELQTQFPASDQTLRAQAYMTNNGC